MAQVAPSGFWLSFTSASSYYAQNVHAGALYYGKRQALWLAVGLAACLATARADYQRYQRRYALVGPGTVSVSAVGACEARTGDRAGILAEEDAAPAEGTTTP